MHASESTLICASIAAAIEAGETWSPKRHVMFVRGIAAGGAVPQFYSKGQPRLRATAQHFVNGKPIPSSPRITINANELRECLIHCEEDEARHKTKDIKPRDETKDLEPGDETLEGNGQRECKKVLVTRFGVGIEGLTIDGALDLRGFRLGRPFSLINCEFNHTLDLSDARLASLDLSRSNFVGAKDASTGERSLAGARMENIHVEGRANFEYLHADFVTLTSAVISGVASLYCAEILWRTQDGEPLKVGALPQWRADPAIETAVSFNGATASHIILRSARVHGTLDLIELKAGSIELDRAKIVALLDAHGNRERAIEGRSLRLDSRLDFGARAEIEADRIQVESAISKLTPKHFRNIAREAQTLIVGAIWLNSAEIGGDIRAQGVQFVRGLSMETIRDLNKKSKKTTSRDEREMTRLIVLRNSRIRGSVLFGDRNVEIPFTDEQQKEFRTRREIVKMSCDGEIDLRNATIDGDVRFVGCKFTNCVKEREVVLDLRMSDIGRMLAFTHMDEKSVGQIDMRDARARVYRDDFVRADKGLLPPLRSWFNTVYLWLLAAIFAAIEITVSLITLRFFAADVDDLWSRVVRARDLFEFERDKRIWPKKLLFVLAGFRYDSFPVRGEIGGDDTGDTERMAILAGERIRWLRQQPKKWLHDKFQPQPFVQCAEVLRDLGYDRQAHAVLLRREKQALQSRAVGPLEKMARLLLITMCGQGHQMYLLAVWAAVFLAIGLVFNTVAINANLMRPTSDEVIVSEAYREHGRLPADYSSLNPIPFTVKRLLPIPPMAGTNEWAGCNWRQIRMSVLNGTDGACVPRICQFAEEHHKEPQRAGDGNVYLALAAGKVQQCSKLPLIPYAKPRRDIDGPSVNTDADLRICAFLNRSAVAGGTASLTSLDKKCEPAPPKSIREAVYADVLSASPTIKTMLDRLSDRLNFEIFGLKPLVYIYNAAALLIYAFLLPLSWLVVAAASFLGIGLDVSPFAPIETFDLVFTMNKYLSDGGLTQVNMALGVMGWLISIILATYATGVLKRRE